MTDASPPIDLLLSSGFLAFGRHIGFLEAVDECELPVHSVYGTSSGALVGAMWSAGMSPSEILQEVTAHRPIDWMATSWTPWNGIFDLSPMVSRLRQVLPATFAELKQVGRAGFAAGVRRQSGDFAFVSAGDLPLAVAASCAIPWVFRKIELELDGSLEPCDDGGAVDRLGFELWQRVQPQPRTAIVHLVDRSAGAQTDDDLSAATVVRSPRSGAGFWTLGDVQGRAGESRRLARKVLESHRSA